MSATVIQGKDLMVFFGTGSNKKVCAHASEFKLSIQKGTKERSSKDAGDWTELTTSKLKWNLSTSGLVTYDANAQSFEYLYDSLLSDTPLTVTFAVAGGTLPAWSVDTTKLNFVGTAILNNLDLNSPTDDDATYSASFEGHGPLNKIAGVPA